MRFLIVQDFKENRKKCTLTALEGKEEFSFVRLAHPSRPSARRPLSVELGDGILLEVGAPPLTHDDRQLATTGHVVLLDSTWARVCQVRERVRARTGARLVRRSLPDDVVTAYPRVSKLYEEPSAGLASVEAIYAVTAILGEPRADFLDGYRWAEEFLQRNRLAFGVDDL